MAQTWTRVGAGTWRTAVLVHHFHEFPHCLHIHPLRLLQPQSHPDVLYADARFSIQDLASVYLDKLVPVRFDQLPTFLYSPLVALVLLLEVNRKLSLHCHWHTRGAFRLRLGLWFRILFLDQILNTHPAGLSGSLQHYLLRREHFDDVLFVDFLRSSSWLNARRYTIDIVRHSLAAFLPSRPKSPDLDSDLYNIILASNFRLVTFLSALHTLKRRHLLPKLNGMDNHVQVVLRVLLKVGTNELLSSNLPHLVIRHVNALEVGDQLWLLHIL